MCIYIYIYIYIYHVCLFSPLYPYMLFRSVHIDPASSRRVHRPPGAGAQESSWRRKMHWTSKLYWIIMITIIMIAILPLIILLIIIVTIT